MNKKQTNIYKDRQRETQTNKQKQKQSITKKMLYNQSWSKCCMVRRSLPHSQFLDWILIVLKLNWLWFQVCGIESYNEWWLCINLIELLPWFIIFDLYNYYMTLLCTLHGKLCYFYKEDFYFEKETEKRKVYSLTFTRDTQCFESINCSTDILAIPLISSQVKVLFIRIVWIWDM